MRRVNYKEKGITLIALVITIIILLILAGVTLTTALGQNGLFERAKYAGEKYKESEADESEKLGEVEREIDKIIDGEDPQKPTTGKIPEEMQVGDVVHYTPDTTETSYNLPSNKSGYISAQNVAQQTYTWKVLNINEDSVDIMGVPTSSMSTVYFRGPTGYNNGVYLLDDICKTLYSNSDLSTEARSLDLQDIESKMNEEGIKARDIYVKDNIKYGEIKEYSENDDVWYPKLAEYENALGIDDGGINTAGIGESDDGTGLTDKGITIPLLEDDVSSVMSGHYTSSRKKAGSKMTVKQNYYYFDSPSVYFDDDKFYNLIFGTGTKYWLASRFTACFSESPNFGLRDVSGAKLAGITMFCPSELAFEGEYRIAPVVSLPSTIQYTSAGEKEWDIK